MARSPQRTRGRNRRIKAFSFNINVEGIRESDGDFFKKPSSADEIINLHADKQSHFTCLNQGYASVIDAGSGIQDIGSYFNTKYYIPYIQGSSLEIYDVSASSKVSGTGTHTITNADFVQFDEVLYITSSSASPKKWTGSGAITTVSGWPVNTTYDNPKLSSVFVNRVVYANFSNHPSSILLSETEAPEGYTIGTADTNAAIIAVNPGDGEEITALETIYNPSTNTAALVIFKPSSVYFLTGDTPNTFSLQQISNDYGCLNKRAVTKVGNDIHFMSKANIYSVAASIESGTLQPTVLSGGYIEDTYEEANFTNASDIMWCEHLPWRREVWYGIASGSSSNIDVILVYRYFTEQDDAPLWTKKTSLEANCAVSFDNRLFTGDSVGDISEWFNTSSYKGETVNWKYTYPYYDFESLAQNKRIHDLYGWFFSITNQQIDVTARWEQSRGSRSRTYTIDVLKGGGVTYGSGVYNIDLYSESLGAVVKAKLPVRGNGQRVQLEVEGTSTATPTFLGLTGIVEFGYNSRMYN